MQPATTPAQAHEPEPAKKSVLDEIIEREAARYLPVMTPATAKKRKAAIQDLKDNVLVEGEDYGVIPGTDKPTLLKPGAEKICAFFGYVPQYTYLTKTEDWLGEAHNGEPLFYYHVRCDLVRDDKTVGQGQGSCSSWESKYRFRAAQRSCPSCGQQTIIKGKEEYGGGWLCFAKKGGCGAKYDDNDPEIMGQAVGRIANPAIFDVVNTVQKIADKRSYIAATLSATGASQWFTQDLEDQPPPEDQPQRRQEGPQRPQTATGARGPATAAKPAAAPTDAATSGAGPTAQGGPQQAAPPGMDPELVDLLKTFRAADRFGRLKAYGQLKLLLHELTGGDGEYYRVLGEAGVQHADQFKSLKAADQTFQVLFHLVKMYERQRDQAERDIQDGGGK